jgi:hypothetical protein
MANGMVLIELRDLVQQFRKNTEQQQENFSHFYEKLMEHLQNARIREASKTKCMTLGLSVTVQAPAPAPKKTPIDSSQSDPPSKQETFKLCNPIQNLANVGHNQQSSSILLKNLKDTKLPRTDENKRSYIGKIIPSCALLYNGHGVSHRRKRVIVPGIRYKFDLRTHIVRVPIAGTSRIYISAWEQSMELTEYETSHTVRKSNVEMRISHRIHQPRSGFIHPTEKFRNPVVYPTNAYV